MADCLICAKHRGEGPLVGERIWSDELVIASHLPVPADGTATLGYVFVETRRHVASLAELSEQESRSAARAAWRLAQGVRAEVGPAFVFTAVVGLGIPHFHQHVIPRYGGTPTEVGWMDSTTWSGAVQGDSTQVAALARRLRTYL